MHYITNRPTTNSTNAFNLGNDFRDRGYTICTGLGGGT